MKLLGIKRPRETPKVVEAKDDVVVVASGPTETKKYKAVAA